MYFTIILVDGANSSVRLEFVDTFLCVTSFLTSLENNATGSFIFVNYEEYFVVSWCQNLENGNTMHNVWIASRTLNLSDELRQEINEKLTGIIDIETLEDVRHKYCRKIERSEIKRVN